jgi:hypothetical protein
MCEVPAEAHLTASRAKSQVTASQRPSFSILFLGSWEHGSRDHWPAAGVTKALHSPNYIHRPQDSAHFLATAAAAAIDLVLHPASDTPSGPSVCCVYTPTALFSSPGWLRTTTSNRIDPPSSIPLFVFTASKPALHHCLIAPRARLCIYPA